LLNLPAGKPAKDVPILVDESIDNFNVIIESRRVNTIFLSQTTLLAHVFDCAHWNDLRVARESDAANPLADSRCRWAQESTLLGFDFDEVDGVIVRVLKRETKGPKNPPQFAERDRTLSALDAVLMVSYPPRDGVHFLVGGRSVLDARAAHDSMRRDCEH